MAKPEKEQTVQEISEKLRSAEGIYLVDFTGLNVAEANELRRRCREVGVEYRVVKNTLTKLALKEVDLEILSEYVAGPTALSLGYDDPIAPAKILRKFVKERTLPRVKIGLVEGRLVPPEEVGRIAELPSGDVLLMEVVSSLAYPSVSLVLTLGGILSDFVRTLEAVEGEKARLAQGGSGEE